MKQLIQHANYTNRNIHYFRQTSKIISDLDNNEQVSDVDSYPKLTYPQNTLLMIIVNTPENYVSHPEKNLKRNCLLIL